MAYESVKASTRSSTKVTDCLPNIALEIQCARDRDELRNYLTRTVVEYFGACRSRLCFFDEEPEVLKILQKGEFAITKHVLSTHFPAHEGRFFTAGEWAERNRRYDHGHVIAGPIFGNGVVIGILALTRTKDSSAFNDTDALTLGALCAHISTWKNSRLKIPLSNREQELLSHVQSGHSNSEIAAFLKISENGVKQALKRLFRKCSVSTRAELAAIGK